MENKGTIYKGEVMHDLKARLIMLVIILKMNMSL